MAEKRIAIVHCDPGVQNTGTVENIVIAGSDRDEALAEVVRARYPADYLTADCTGYSVAIGDRWQDGRFYHGAEPAVRLQTEKEQLAELRQNARRLDLAVLELMDHLTQRGGEADV